MKRLLALLLALCICVGLCACGEGKSDGNEGKYLGVQVEMDGVVLPMEEVYDGECYLELKSGGKAVLVLEGDKMTGKWSLDDDELELVIEDEKCPGTLEKGVVTFDLAESGVILTFAKKGKGSTSNEKDPDGGEAAAVFPEDVAEEFYGDWHGWCAVVDGTDDYEDEIDNEFEMLARFAIDEDGVCQPWMSIYSDSEDNFKDVTVYYDEDDQFVHMEGQLFGMTIEPHSEIYYTYGSLVMTIYLKGDNGTMQIAVTLRQPETEWDSYDFPCMPADAQEFYKDKSFEEIVELYGLDMADLPELP